MSEIPVGAKQAAEAIMNILHTADKNIKQAVIIFKDGDAECIHLGSMKAAEEIKRTLYEADKKVFNEKYGITDNMTFWQKMSKPRPYDEIFEWHCKEVTIV
jgi:hypothetical protein